MSRASHHPEAGFTLTELLVVVGLLTILTGLLVAIMYQLWRVPQWGSAQMTVDNDLRTIGLWLLRDGNQSNDFIAGGSCGTFHTGHGPTYIYALNGTTLERTDQDGNKVIVARHVQGISCMDAGTQVQVTVQVARGPVAASQTFTVTMRAQR